MWISVVLVAACQTGGTNAAVETMKRAEPDALRIGPGSGHFEVPGGPGREEKSIEVYYNVPTDLSSDSQVLFVVPGAGRDAWAYRDIWVEASEHYGVVVLSPRYSEEDYPEFWSYNLAGMLSDVELNESRTAMVGYEINLHAEEWIFDDFPRIFRQVRQALKLETNTYDMFGHSAGAQLLHRYVLFGPASLSQRVIAANSGWYTIPMFDDVFPYGLVNSAATEPDVSEALGLDLVVLLGELDDENETRGDLVRTPEVDVQGTSRIERGRYFYDKAEQTAERLGVRLYWSLHVVPGVGHDRVGMSRAAAQLLYGQN